MLFQSLHTLKINIPSYSNNFIKIHEKSASALAILSSIKQLFEYFRPLGYKYAKTRKSWIIKKSAGKGVLFEDFFFPRENSHWNY
jgi:Tfp pilus assembly protein PilE